MTKIIVVPACRTHKKAAGVEYLLFGPDKHKEGAGILTQLVRMAVIGDSPLLGGRVMLRVSFFRVSRGAVGSAQEATLDELTYPSTLHFDAWVEICTPNGELYAVSPLRLSGRVVDATAKGTELRADGKSVALRTNDHEIVGELSGFTLVLGDALAGADAPVNDEVVVVG
ncbi:MAG: hypothetical protein JO202_08395 [Ktedonobacteraceae bacterium]|nr:hypothetical protein [Ktedonobacteraceae bacterium]